MQILYNFSIFRFSECFMVGSEIVILYMDINVLQTVGIHVKDQRYHNQEYFNGSYEINDN